MRRSGVVLLLALNGCVRAGPPASQAAALKPVPGATAGFCPFPRTADLAEVDDASVLLQITVAPTGIAESVTILRDPGYGFGQMAGECAFAHAYTPAHDAEGNAVRGTFKLRMHFSRPAN